MVDAVNPPDVWAPFGAFSLAAIQGDGQIVHLKGQVALDEDGCVVAPGDMAGQVSKTLENIASVLSSMGGALEDVLSLVHYTTDIDRFLAAGDVRKAFFSPPYPATTTVQVSRLYRPELLIEIAAIAEIPRDRFRRPGA
jgi:enamine deaminase RidA (YjgF/YER057c/UK114 family)